MNGKFFQRIFGQKSHESLPRTRRLSLEALENREMLNADWSGFASETVTEYEVGSASYSVALPSNVDEVALVNLEGDSACELVSIYGQGKTVSIYTANSSGEFTVKSEQTIDALGNWGLYSDAVFKDLNNDGYDEMLLVSSTGLSLNACVYTWNSTTSSFSAGTVYTLDATPFIGSASRYVFTGVNAAVVANASSGYDLVLQVDTLSTTSQSTNTCVYSGLGRSSFGQNPVLKSAIQGELLGSTTIDGQDYLLLKEATSSTNYLVLSNLGSQTTTKTYYDFSGYGSKYIFNWVVEQDGFLVLGSVLASSMTSGLVTLNLTSAPEDGATVDAVPLGKWYDCRSFSLSSSSVAAIGNVGGDSDPELLVANDEAKASVFYLGDASTSYGYTFTQSEVVVATPNYNSVYVGDYNDDGKQDALLVGSSYLYAADVNDEGEISNQRVLYKFSQPTAEAVFGDFNGDGLVDIAVRFKANVGSSLQTFIQVANGEFVLTASQTVPGTLVDFTVGRFTQNKADEIAVMYTLYKNSTTMTFAAAYKYDSSRIALVASASGSYVGIGTSIAAGELYDSGRDDLVVVNSSADTVSVFKNTGSGFSVSSVSTRYEGTNFCYPTSATIGDFNGDGLNDLAVMNSSAGSNVAEVAYYLRSSSGIGSKPTGRVRVNSTISVIDNTSVVGQLQAVDLNDDAYDDLVFIRRSTAGASYASVLLGNGETSVFNALKDYSVSCDAAVGASYAMAYVDKNNDAPDLVWVQDKSVGVLINQQTDETFGKVQYVLQSLSSASGASYADALSTQRTWLDEWSNFYVDVWAYAEDFAVESVEGSFTYDSDLFTFVDAVAVKGYAVSTETGDGSISFTAVGSAALDADGWTIVARLKFQPVSGGGLSLAANGALYAANPGFNAPARAQKVNEISVTSSAVPAGVEVYPLAYDLNDNGEVDLEDFAYFISYYPANPASSIPVAKHRVLDVNANSQYDLEDFSYAIAAYPSKWSDGVDSGYSVKPVLKGTSSAVLDAELVAAVLDAQEELFDDVELAAAVEEIAPVEATVRTFEQTFGAVEQQPLVTEQTVFFCGPMNKPDADSKLDLTVEWDLDL